MDALLAWSDGLRSGVANAQPAAAASDSDGMIVQVTEEEEQAISEALADWRQRNSSGGMAPAEDDQCAQAVRAAKLAIRGKSGSPRGARSLEAALEAVMAGNGAPPADATDDEHEHEHNMSMRRLTPAVRDFRPRHAVWRTGYQRLIRCDVLPRRPCH